MLRRTSFIAVAASLVYLLGCGRGGIGQFDGGGDVSVGFDAANDFGGAGVSGGGGSTGGSGGLGGALGGSAGGSFTCLDAWPAAPTAVEKAMPLSVQPGLLWSVSMPVAITNAPPFPASPMMAATGTGVAVSFSNQLLIYDGDGKPVAAVAATPSSQQYPTTSSPVSDVDGSVYFFDWANARRLDASGKVVWTTPIGSGVPRGSPVLDGSGNLYLPAGDGTLQVLDTLNGRILSTSPLGLTAADPGNIHAGVGSALFIDPGTAGASTTIVTENAYSVTRSAWIDGPAIGGGMYSPSPLLGYEIGIVSTAPIDIDAETTEVDVLDTCWRRRWQVPGNYAVPLAVTFGDDLIVTDRIPNGQSAPLNHDYALRRFSKDGVLLAGPVSVPDQFCGRAFVGADDTFYFIGGSSDGYRLRAYDSSLSQLWTTPFPHCPDAALLNADGKVFTARGLDATLAAIQTTSPGPAAVSWSHAVGRNARGTQWLGP
jgi:hypothetical protein